MDNYYTNITSSTTNNINPTVINYMLNCTTPKSTSNIITACLEFIDDKYLLWLKPNLKRYPEYIKYNFDF